MNTNMSFNLGSHDEQNIIITVDEFGTIQAYTYANKEMYLNELELAKEFGTKVLFKSEVKTT